MKGAHAATIGHMALLVDDVEPLRPGGVRIVSGVADVVDAEDGGVVEALDEIVGDGYALGECFWLRVADVVLHVGVHLPLVSGMRFAYVDGEKVGVIFVIVVNLHHVTDVAAERRSSVAAEDDDEWPATSFLADVKMIRAVQSD